MTSILVVEDDRDVRSLVQVAFRLAGGWNVTTAASLASATVELERAHFDVVLTDDQLGDGCAADVATRSHGCPVIVLSGSVDGPRSTLVRWPGFAGGISKPFDPMTLPALVASVARRNGNAVQTTGHPTSGESCAIHSGHEASRRDVVA
ncbi:response regulator [Tessaracoccus sp.]